MDNETESKILGVMQRYRKGGWSDTTMAVVLAPPGDGSINESIGSTDNISSDATAMIT